jgi:hypothetical protein
VALLDPRSWAGFVPNGTGQVKPNHCGEMLKALWRNRDELPYAWRILRKGRSVRRRAEVVSMEARVRTAPIRVRNLQVQWPEGNALIRRGRVDPRRGEPDFNAVVEVIAR